MDDERLLSEALRAQAAGGVSTPRAVPSPPPDPTTSMSTDAAPTRPRRFRPLGRRRAATSAGAPTTVHPTVRADVPAPRTSGGAARPPGAAPPGPGRPAPSRPGPPPTGPWPGPTSGPVPAHSAYPPPRPPQPTAPAAGPGTWPAGTVAWWSLVSLLAGGTVGAAGGVLSLLLPA